MAAGPGYGPPKPGWPKPGGRRTLVAPGFAGLPPAVVSIPWIWLTVPLAIRPDVPINSAQITQVGQSASTAVAASSIAAYTTFTAATDLQTILDPDASNYALWLVTYYANPLLRCPMVTMDLVPRTPAERATILGAEIGQRFTLTAGTVIDANGNPYVIPIPARLPTAVQSMVIEGITHTSSVTVRTVTWACAPLIGATPGVEGPWFRLDSSTLGDTDAMPF